MYGLTPRKSVAIKQTTSLCRENHTYKMTYLQSVSTFMCNHQCGDNFPSLFPVNSCPYHQSLEVVPHARVKNVNNVNFQACRIAVFTDNTESQFVIICEFQRNGGALSASNPHVLYLIAVRFVPYDDAVCTKRAAS